MNQLQNRKTPGFWLGVIRKLKLAGLLLKENRVPIWAKLIPALVLIYIIAPVDFLPDLLPILGQVDDLTLLILGLEIFINISPKQVVKEIEGKISK